MKTYIVTKKQIEELQNTFSMDGNAWWFNARMDEWVDKLGYLETEKADPIKSAGKEN